jgi:hypothetical protein
VVVDVEEVRLRAAEHRLVCRLVTRERAGTADHDLCVRDLRYVGAARARRGDGEERESGDRGPPPQCETAFRSTESASVARPIVIEAPGCTSSRKSASLGDWTVDVAPR